MSYINSIMKLNYSNKTLINIPLCIYYYSHNKITFKLDRNITMHDTKLLWNVDDINIIKINIYNNQNFNLINDYIYKYHLINYNNNSYKLTQNKIMISPFSKTLNSCWFLSNLYK